MDFPAVRLIAHALNVILSARRCLCLYFWWRDPSDLLNDVLAGLSSSPAETSFNMHNRWYIHRSRQFYWIQVFKSLLIISLLFYSGKII